MKIAGFWKSSPQFILAYACVMYVTLYMVKSERAMGGLLKQVSKECESESKRYQLRRLGITFLIHWKVSAQEGVYWLLSMPSKRQSRKAVFINTDLLKPLSQITQLEDDNDDLHMTSLIDRYAARPDILEHLCLAEFAANYDVW